MSEIMNGLKQGMQSAAEQERKRLENEHEWEEIDKKTKHIKKQIKSKAKKHSLVIKAYLKGPHRLLYRELLRLEPYLANLPSSYEAHEAQRARYLVECATRILADKIYKIDSQNYAEKIRQIYTDKLKELEGKELEEDEEFYLDEYLHDIAHEYGKIRFAMYQYSGNALNGALACLKNYQFTAAAECAGGMIWWLDEDEYFSVLDGVLKVGESV